MVFPLKMDILFALWHLPIIELNPHFEQSVAQSNANIASIEKWLQAEFQIWKQEHCQVDAQGNVFVKLSDTGLAEKERVMRQQLLLAYRFTADAMGHILEAGDTKIGNIFESPSHILNIDRQQWVISTKDQWRSWHNTI